MDNLRRIARRVLPSKLKLTLHALIDRARKSMSSGPAPLQAAREVLKTEKQIARTSRRSKALFNTLNGKRDLKLHLGCGDDIRPGWINIDIRNEINPKDQVPGAVFIPYDLRVGLPLENESCKYIYSSHFWEHLEENIGAELIRQCYRVLQPGGTFRIALPAVQKAFEAYVSHDAGYFSVGSHMMNLSFPKTYMIDYINWVVYNGYGPEAHKCCYDPEKIIYVLQYIGFSRVNTSSFSQDVDINNELRTHYTFYVDAVK